MLAILAFASPGAHGSADYSVPVLGLIFLRYADHKFEQMTRKKRRKIGTVIIGRGSLTWKKRKGQIGRRMSWSRLAEIMEE